MEKYSNGIVFDWIAGRRCRALYDCEADNDDEVSFREGEILVVMVEKTEDDNWMEGYVENDPQRRGVFPASFVHILNERENVWPLWPLSFSIFISPFFSDRTNEACNWSNQLDEMIGWIVTRRFPVWRTTIYTKEK